MGSMTRIDGSDALPAAPAGLLCLMIADRRAMPAVLRAITGAGVFAETPMRADIGTPVTLRHPQAGTIEAEVLGHERIGMRLGFDRSEAAIGFALAAIASGIRARA